MRNKLLLLLLFLSPFALQAQNDNKTPCWSIGYYSFNNDFGIAFVKSSKIQPELRFKTIHATNIEASLLLRTNCNVSNSYNVNLSYGVGASVNDLENNSNVYCRVPIYFVKNNVLTKNLNFMLGFEVKTDFDDYKILPGVGVNLNF